MTSQKRNNCGFQVWYTTKNIEGKKLLQCIICDEYYPIGTRHLKISCELLLSCISLAIVLRIWDSSGLERPDTWMGTYNMYRLCLSWQLSMYVTLMFRPLIRKQST